MMRRRETGRSMGEEGERERERYRKGIQLVFGFNSAYFWLELIYSQRHNEKQCNELTAIGVMNVYTQANKYMP